MKKGKHNYVCIVYLYWRFFYKNPMSYIGKMGYVTHPSRYHRHHLMRYGICKNCVYEEAMKFLVTGAAGFIGSNVSKRLLEAGHQVVGIDNLNDYYDVNLKLARLELLKSENFTFHKLDLADREGMAALFAVRSLIA
jgi:UDP-glucuronate 4-epimerase